MHRLHYAIVLLLLPLLLGADEDLAPNDDLQSANWSSSRGSACSTASPQCYTDVDDDPDGTPDGAWNYDPDNEVLMDWYFPTPTSNPSTTTNAQVFDIVISKCEADGTRNAGGSDPTYTLARVCTGGLGTIESAVSVTGLNQDGGGTFTVTGQCQSDGSDVALRLTGTCNGGGPNKRCLCVEAIEWEVTWAAVGGRTRRMF